ncbi:MAG: 4a-hydroxytetrahydrobiopterin dehydratase [Candidatus Zixiibacteriota bacterium]
MENLTLIKCRPCEGGVLPLTEEESAPYLRQLENWTVTENKKIEREFPFRDFAEALKFVDAVGAVAETEGHHPDILLHGWNKVKIVLYTHAIGGLSINDFIVAAKIEKIKP